MRFGRGQGGATHCPGPRPRSFSTADLPARTLAALGRGYRAVQLDAGMRAGPASLGAYACGLGATGLTFYGDEVRRFLGTDEEPMMRQGLAAHRQPPAVHAVGSALQ